MTTSEEASPIFINEFCQRNRIGRSTAYLEIAEGRLVAHKRRGRTVILPTDEKAWRASVRKIEPASAAA